MSERRLKRRDANHSVVAKRFDEWFCSVVDCSQVGGGCPDLLVGKSQRAAFVEIKTQNGELSETQVDFSVSWRGCPIFVVKTVDEVERVVRYLDTGKAGA